jgi:hypothetical protein
MSINVGERCLLVWFVYGGDSGVARWLGEEV